MEIRRIEGILLQHAIEQSQSAKAQRAGEELSIKVLSTVPDVLLELTAGGEGAIRAKVSYSGGNMLTLTLPNGFELNAENRSSLNLMAGDTVELALSSTNPLTFRVVSLQRRFQPEDVLSFLFEGDNNIRIPLQPESLKQGIENSGVFYERKLLDLFLGKIRPEELFKDTKARLIQSILPYAESLSSLLGVNYEKSLDGIKSLFELLKAKVFSYEKASTAMRTLMFQNVSPEEYANLLSEMEARGENTLLTAVKERDAPVIIRELFRLLSSKSTEGQEVLQKVIQDLQGSEDPAVKELFRLLSSKSPGGQEALQKAIQDLQGLEDPAVKELFRAIEQGSENTLREAYRGFRDFLEKGERLMEFYQTKGHQMEYLLNRLELINNLQWSALNHQQLFHIPFYHEGGRGGIIIRGGKDYTVVFNLDYEVNFIGGLMRMPKNARVLDIRLYTDIPSLAERLRESKDRLALLIEEEGLKLRAFSVELVQRDKLIENLRDAFTQEGFFLLA